MIMVLSETVRIWSIFWFDSVSYPNNFAWCLFR